MYIERKNVFCQRIKKCYLRRLYLRTCLNCKWSSLQDYMRLHIITHVKMFCNHKSLCNRPKKILFYLH